MDKKGISTIIATILMLLVLVAIIGVAFTWFMTTTSGMQTTTEERVSVLEEQLGRTISTDSIICSVTELKVYVRNTGTKQINASTVLLYFDDVYRGNNTFAIPQGSVGVVNGTVSSCSGTHRIKVAGPSNTIETIKIW